MDFLSKGFILSLDYLSNNKNINSYLLNKFILSFSADCLYNKIKAIKLNSYNLILDIKYSSDILIIGYINRIYPNSIVNITPTLNEIHELAKAGAEVIYIDASMKIRPNSQTIHEFYYKIKSNFPEIKFIGEISTIDDIRNISDLHFDGIAIKGDYNLIDTPEIGFLNSPIIFNSGYDKIDNCNEVFGKGYNNIIINSKIFMPHYRINEFIQNIF